MTPAGQVKPKEPLVLQMRWPLLCRDSDTEFMRGVAGMKQQAGKSHHPTNGEIADRLEEAAGYTAITSRFGPLKGRRIVRGRERECRALYDLDTAEAQSL